MTAHNERSWRKLPVWRGMTFANWLRLLALRPPMDASAAGKLLSLTFTSVANSMLGCVESALYGRAVRKVELHPSPIFVLGHWRTGTTLLHELLALDPQFAYINLYQTVFPTHFLLTEKLVVPATRRLLPATRPMDNMETGWQSPQEDEMAMMLLTLYSQYLAVAFHDSRKTYLRYKNFSTGLSPRELQHWKGTLLHLLRKVAYAGGRNRFVLKSPPHTARIPVLKEIFPQACFVHLVRNPFEVYASTIRLRRVMAQINGFTKAGPVNLEAEVLDDFMQFYQAYHTHRALLDESQVYDLRYEDLVADPVAALEDIYRHFKVPGFEDVRPKLEARMNAHREYRTSTTPLPYDEQVRVYEHWAPAFRRYGYPGPQPQNVEAPTAAE